MDKNKQLVTLFGIVFIAVALLLIFILIFDHTGFSTSDSKKETIKIGIILPLSGSSGFMGQGAQNAVQLALDKLSREDTNYDYKVVYEDDKLDPKLTSNAIQKLININDVDAVISFSSGSGNIVSPLTQSNKVLHVGVASDANIAKGEYNFIHWTTPEEENRVFIKELQNRGIKRLAVISMNQQGAEAVLDDLQKKVKNTDIELVSIQRVNFGDKDFKTVLLKAKESNPDAYYVAVFSPELEILGRQAKELNIEPLVAIEAFEYSEQTDLFEGYWYVQAADPTEEFSQEYKQRYGSNPVIASPNVYDAFNLIVEAFENSAVSSGKKPSPEDVAFEFSQIKNFDGALGTLNVGSDGIVQSKAVVKEVRNGEFVTVNKGE